MARPQKETIDYFPHYAYQGKTMLILQNEFGNDGYAFWYRLLELLCKSENQVYDYNNPAAWRLLLAETHVKEDTATNILKVLADVEAIDNDLYKSKLIWVQNLVNNLDDVYNRRTVGKPQKPVSANNNAVNANNNAVNAEDCTPPHDTIYNPPLNKTKQDKTKQDNTILLQVFDHWNDQNIIIHKIMNGNESTIKTALKYHSLDEVKLSITTYSEILKGDQYFFKFKWTLNEFLRRGLDKFINPEIARQNYLKYRDGGQNGVNRGNNAEQPKSLTQRLEESWGKSIEQERKECGLD